MPDSNMSERLLRQAHPDADALTQNWIAVASAEHVRRGRADGFMQVCHGKGGPLARIRAGARAASLG